jgi:hypothetical protein
MHNKMIFNLGLIAIALGSAGQAQALNFNPPVAYELGGVEATNLAVVDINQDGFLDVVSSTGGGFGLRPKTHFLLGDGSGGLFKDNSLNLNSKGGFYFADFNNDGILDIAAAAGAERARTWKNSVRVLLGAGGQTPGFALKRTFDVPGDLSVLDYDGDGNLDIRGSDHFYYGAGHSNGQPIPVIALGNGDGTFAPLVPASGIAPAPSTQNSPVVAGQRFNAQYDRSNPSHVLTVSTANYDMNNDGIDDHLSFNVGSSQVSIVVSRPDGTFAAPQLITIVGAGGVGPVPLAIGDFNQDGWPDIAIADNPNQQDASLWVSLQVPGTSVDNQVPTVQFTAPTAGDVLSNQVSLSVNANDNIGVTQVDFYANDQLLGTSAGPNFALAWDTRQVNDGAYTLLTTAWDAAGNSSDATLTVDVNNSLPVITSVPGNTNQVGLGATYSYQVIASGKQPLSYQLLQAPTGMVIDNAGFISWTPDVFQLGPNPVTVEVSNSFGTDQQTLTVSAVDVTSPSIPTNLHIIGPLSPNSVTIGWDAAADNTTVTGYQLSAWSRSNRHVPLAFRPVGNYTTLSADMSGRIGTFAIAAFDAAGNISARSASIEIGTSPVIRHDGQNAPLEISSNPSGASNLPRYYLAKIGQPFTHTVTTTGEQPVNLSLISGPAGMVLNGKVLEWTPVAGQEGIGSVTVHATNRVGSRDYTFSYQVTAQVNNTAPVVAATNSQDTFTLPPHPSASSHGIGGPLTIPLNPLFQVSDDGLPGGDLTYSWKAYRNQGLTYTNQSYYSTTARQFSITNPNSANASITFNGQPGLYNILLTVSDGEFTRFAYARANVKLPNQAPILYLGSPTAMTITLPTDQVTFYQSVGDETIRTDGVSYTWSKLSGPGTVALSNTTGTLFKTGYYNTPRPRTTTVATFSSAGNYTIQVKLTDAQGLSSTRQFQVTVNPAPAPQPQPPTGQKVEFEGTISAVTADGFVVNGLTVKITPSSIIKGNGSSRTLPVGFPVQGKGIKSADGIISAIKVEVG